MWARERPVTGDHSKPSLNHCLWGIRNLKGIWSLSTVQPIQLIHYQVFQFFEMIGRFYIQKIQSIHFNTPSPPLAELTIVFFSQQKVHCHTFSLQFFLYASIPPSSHFKLHISNYLSLMFLLLLFEHRSLYADWRSIYEIKIPKTHKDFIPMVLSSLL